MFTYIFAADHTALMALRCLRILFAPIKTKKLGEIILFILKVVPVSTAKFVVLLYVCMYVNLVCLQICSRPVIYHDVFDINIL